MLDLNKRNVSILKRIDYPLVVLYTLLISAGWVMIFGASYDLDQSSFWVAEGRPMMQLLWIALGVLLIFVIFFIRSDIFEVASKPLYALTLLILIATIFLAPNIKGSHSWLVIGPVRIQPAELAKMTTSLMLAYRMSRYNFKLEGWRSYLELFAIILAPMAIIFLQSEAGSALVFASFFLVLYREGMSGFFLGVAVLSVILFVSALSFSDKMLGGTSLDLLIVSSTILFALLLLLGLYTRKNKLFVQIVSYTLAFCIVLFPLLHYWVPSFDYAYVVVALLAILVGYCLFMAIRHYALRFFLVAATGIVMSAFSFSVGYVYEEVLKPHQQMRIAVALGLETDVRGVGYNVNQAKIAIGSGGFMGKGFLGATQTKLKYVPEQDTDFIFCTVAEEYGFIGSTLLLLLYLALILRIMYLAQRQYSVFNRIYGYCIACILLMHVTVNVGMVLGLVPVIGIPLPFCSYGGSSLWSFTMMLFIFIRLCAEE